jgi:hypothetical protein
MPSPPATMNQNALFAFVWTSYFLFNLLAFLRPNFVFLYDLLTRVAYAIMENCMQYDNNNKNLFLPAIRAID